MNYGKLNEDIYERSVVKVIRNNSLYNGAESGSFCAFFPCQDFVVLDGAGSAGGNGFVNAQAAAGGRNAVIRAYEAALNSIAAGGFSLCASDCYQACADISLFVPEKLREIKVREMLAETAQRADGLHIPLMNVNVQVLPWIQMETANCVVHIMPRNLVDRKGASPGDDIVMTKWLGLEGTALIVRSSPDKLKARYPADLVDEAAGFLDYLSVIPEAATAMKSGAGDMQAVREGGIFGGLWELAAKNSVGLVADLECIPVKQETYGKK